jgi:hypothetical protein
MTIDVEEPDGVCLVTHPALGQSLTERRRLPAGRQLCQLAPQGLDLGRAVEPEQDAQFPGGMSLQLLRTDCGFGREGLARRIAFYKCVAITLGANLVRRELKLPEAPIPAADPRFT